MVKDIDPSDIGKHPHLIKRAQEEMANTDVLVCGKCHKVFNFIEQFIEHREEGCTEKSSFRESKETKPKVWAFLLWKQSQLNLEKDNSNAWKLYQNWVKLDDQTRETWVVAGCTIQSFSKIGQGRLQEMPVKITKTVVDTIAKNAAVQIKKPLEKLAVPPVRQVYTKVQLKKDENTNTFQAKNSNQIKSTIKTFDAIKNNLPSPDQMRIVKKPTPIRTPLTKIPPNPVLLNKGVNRMALRTIPNSTREKEEHKIEKILAKRFNPRQKVQEYLIKWENFVHEENTWEPQTNLVNCPQLLDTFEKQLARQKEQRAAMQAKQAQEAAAAAAAATAAASAKPSNAINKTTKMYQSPVQASANTTASSMSSMHIINKSAETTDDSPLRTLRTTNLKSKAMDNVRNWCAQNTEEFARKRKLDDSDYELQDIEDDEHEDDSFTFKESPIRPPPTKMAKTDNSAAVAQALIKAGQSGSVRIVPVNKSTVSTISTILPSPPTIVTTTIAPTKAKLNGANNTVSKFPFDKNSAEVVITNIKDSKQTGIVRKLGGPILSNPIKQKEAQVRIVQKSESATSGLIRISASMKKEPITVTTKVLSNNALTGGVKQQLSKPTTATTTTTIIRQSNTVSKPNIATRPAIPPKRTIAVTQQQQQQQQPQPQQQQKRPIQQPSNRVASRPNTIQQFQRSSLSPATSPNTSTGSVTKTTVRPAPKQVNKTSNNDKLAVLQRQGDLKITRKTYTPANSPSGQMVPVKIKKDEDEDEYDIAEMLSKAAAAAAEVVDSTQSQQSISLCPITGRVLDESYDDEDNEEENSQQISEDVKPIINAAALTSVTATAATSQVQTTKQTIKHEFPLQISEDPSTGMINTTDAVAGDATTVNEQHETHIQPYLTNDDGTPMLVTGEDGTVYQVAGKNEQGQTVLIAQGADGEQQFVYVANEEDDGNAGLMQIDTNDGHQMIVDENGQQTQFILKTADDDGNDETNDSSQMLSIATDGDSQDGQMTAEVIQADLPSPGGTRKVVLMLPDGSFIMTEVSDEQFQLLNIN